MGTCAAALQTPVLSQEAASRGQVIPILVYGAELHQQPTESMRRLVREWQRWIVGAWRGSRADRVEALSGVGDLDTITYKRVRWAASVYGRTLPILREEAERILREVLDPEVQLRWMRGVTGLPVEAVSGRL